jgi:hypothetical protein
LKDDFKGTRQNQKDENRVSLGAFHWTKNFGTFETGAMVRKFPLKVSRKSENCWISEMRTIQPKILEIPGEKSREQKFPVRNFRKFGYTSRRCPLSGNSGKCHSIRH